MSAELRAREYVAKCAGVPLSLMSEGIVREMARRQREHPSRKKRGAIMVAAALYGHLDEVDPLHIDEMLRQGYLDETAYELIKAL